MIGEINKEKGRSRYFSKDKSKKSKLTDSFEFLKKKYSISLEDVKKRISKKEKLERKFNVVPVSIFYNDKLSALESVVKYLKENKKIRFRDIASLLNRDDRTIWYTYNQSRKKLQKKFRIRKGYSIPLSIFRNRKFGVLELVSSELRSYGLTYSQIAKLLKRNQKTIWTVCKRYEKKRGDNK